MARDGLAEVLDGARADHSAKSRCLPVHGAPRQPAITRLLGLSARQGQNRGGRIALLPGLLVKRQKAGKPDGGRRRARSPRRAGRLPLG